LLPDPCKFRIFTCMKKYPIGIQTFSEIREGGYLYVDKTELLYQLTQQGKYFFLSRPRRFGKSLTVSTLKAIFEGKKELFEGLWIDGKYDFSQTFPVVHLELNSLSHRQLGLQTALNLLLDERAAEQGVSLKSTVPGKKLDELIRALATRHGTRVAVLIDEYDKPVIDHLEEPEKAREARDGLKDLYGPLKSLDPHLRFVLLTGVSRFSRMSIFSELNNLEDLTMDQQFAGLTGYTEAEMQRYFADDVAAMATRESASEGDMWQQVRRWYNGYTWDGHTRVYNPFSVLCFMDAMNFGNYWFQMGIPTFLVKLLDRGLQHNFEQLETDTYLLEGGYELEQIDPVVLLFQTGYLTITARDGEWYQLGYPNHEVRESLYRYLLTGFAHQPLSSAAPLLGTLARSFEKNDLQGFEEALNSLFADIPGDIFMARSEAYYHSLTFIVLKLLGSRIRCEVRQSRGRLDAVVETDGQVYVMEFKVDKPAREAIAQIREKGYADSFKADGRKVLLVGVSFSSAQKGVGEMEVEAL